MQISLWITANLSGWLAVWQSLVAIVFESVENSFFSLYTHCQDSTLRRDIELHKAAALIMS